MYFVSQCRTQQCCYPISEREKKPYVCSVQENKDIYVCANSKGLLSQQRHFSGRREKYLCRHSF